MLRLGWIQLLLHLVFRTCSLINGKKCWEGLLSIWELLTLRVISGNWSSCIFPFCGWTPERQLPGIPTDGWVPIEGQIISHYSWFPDFSDFRFRNSDIWVEDTEIFEVCINFTVWIYSLAIRIEVCFRNLLFKTQNKKLVVGSGSKHFWEWQWAFYWAICIYLRSVSYIYSFSNSLYIMCWARRHWMVQDWGSVYIGSVYIWELGMVDWLV